MNNSTNAVQINVELEEEQAWQLAPFLKRVSFSEFRANAENEDDAYTMRDAAGRVREALNAAGYDPR